MMGLGGAEFSVFDRNGQRGGITDGIFNTVCLFASYILLCELIYLMRMASCFFLRGRFVLRTASFFVCILQYFQWIFSIIL